MKKQLSAIADKIGGPMRQQNQRNADVFDEDIISDVEQFQVDLVSHKIEDSDINITEWVGH